MSILMKGGIIDFVPFFKGSLTKNKLVISEDGDFFLTVDTGFSGSIALPLDTFKKLEVELAFYDTFKIATGEVIELPVFLGKAMIKNVDVETWFIPGDYLLGMEFLAEAGSILYFDFITGEVNLTDGT